MSFEKNEGAMSPKTPPGQTRKQVLRFVRERLVAGQPPTVREVQEAFKFRSVQSAREHLEALVAEGKLDKEPGVSRGYRLPGDISMVRSAPVPLLGQVQAGALTEAIEDPDGGYIEASPSSADDELFALRIEGESMIGAGILPGDVVIVRRQQSAESGDLVVALVDNEATVKTLRKTRGKIELHPANPAFEPIVPEPDELVLLGRVVEIRRYLQPSRSAGRKGGR